MAAPPAPEAFASFVAGIASRLSSALPVATGLSAGTGLLVGLEACFVPELTPAVGELDGVFAVGVVAGDDGVVDVPDEPLLGAGLPDGGVPLDDMPPDGDVLGEQLGVDDPVDPPLELPYGVVTPPLGPV